jgi:dinuclear metal center YbgI/SA1388 family protein
MSTRTQLLSFLKNKMNPHLYDDYCPNGLQIEGREHLKKIVFALSATKESVQYATSKNACALIVHHGVFWKFHGTKTITGPFYHRVAPLIKNDTNLIAYHFPLDSHLEFGNAVTIAKHLQLVDIEPFGEYKKCFTGVKGNFKEPILPRDLKTLLQNFLNHQVIYSTPDEDIPLKNIGIITGGANSEWKEALRSNVDAYLTGEMSEHDWHESKESGISMFAGGHHATERPGINALMQTIKKEFPELEVEYFESNNPA